MNNLTRYSVLLAMPFLLSSCSSKLFSKKKKSKQDSAVVVTTDIRANAPAPVVTGAPVATPAPTPLTDLLMPLWNKRIPYKTFSGKAKVSFEGPDGTADFSANFRIAKDSIVWVHITALGGLYPVARMVVTRDSFFMVNYKDKEKTLISLNDVARILPVPVKFSQLQNLFVGDPLADGRLTNAEAKDSSWQLHTEDDTYLQDLSYLKSDSTIAITNLRTRAANGPTALIDYRNYETISERKVSTSRTVHLQNGVKTYTIDMELQNTEFDKPLEFPLTIPANYTLKN